MGKDVKHFRALIGLGTMAPRVIRSHLPVWHAMARYGIARKRLTFAVVVI